MLSRLLLIAAAAAASLYAQGRGAGGPPPSSEKPEEGIPVTNKLVVEKCSTCHKKDDKGNLSRISWERTTPEGWEEAIKRMVRLNGLQITPAEARTIVKYLSSYHGLAPEEAKPVMYMAERRIQDENVPNETIRGTCTNCHAIGRVFSWRRTKEEWKLLTNLHTALYPQAESAFRFRPFNPAAPPAPGGPGGAPGGGGPLPVDQTIDFLAKDYPLFTPEWAAWRARMRAPKITGRWLVSAYIVGRGRYHGEMVIEPGAAEDEFISKVNLQSIRGGPALVHTGTGLVYTGYSWRGRTKASGMPPGAAPNDLSHEMRQVMWISPDQLSAEGRWFWGAYDEFGFDVKMERAGDTPLLITTDRTSLKTGTTGTPVKILGDHLPADVAAADLDFGAGVTVKRIASHSASEIVAELDVASDAVSGKRDVVLRRTVLPAAIAVYDRIDYIKVVPQSTLARLGSETHPKGYQQFEAIAYQRGADGKNYTADDVELGAIDATWRAEEFMAVYGDDDKDFVGQLNDSGFFTPASDGPNPKRKFMRNNYGDIWVVATAKNEKDKDGNPLVGKSYLVVTVPLYIRWDQPEVAQ